MLNGPDVSDSSAAAWPHPPSATGAGAASEPTVVIRARPATTLAQLRALWEYRGFYGFLFKEIMMRKARGTLLGIWWLVLRALIPAAGFIFTFAVVAPVNTGQDIPYSVFFLSGFIPWRLFQGTLTVLPRSLMWMRSIMQRTYFPRLLVPFAGIGPVLIEVALLWIVFAIVVWMSSMGGSPFPLHLGWHTLLLLPSLFGALMFALAFGMVLSIVALFFRDVVFSVGYVAQMFMFLTPVLYPTDAIPESYRWLVRVNPMAQVVELSRLALTGRGEFDVLWIAIAFATILTAFAACTTFFLRAETVLGDQL
jgi:lipopolysaccharide transport system permease protein